MRQVGNNASATILRDLYHMSASTELQVTLKTYSFSWVPNHAARPYQAVLTIGKSRKNETSG